MGTKGRQTSHLVIEVGIFPTHLNYLGDEFDLFNRDPA